MRKNNIIWGFLLIAIGIIVLISKVYGIDIISMELLWPLFILAPGLCFEFSYFIRRRDPGILVPGGILTTLGILFLFQTYTNWRFSEITGPAAMLAVAIGLFQLYIFGRGSKGLLIPVFILGVMGLIGLLTIIFGQILPWLNYSLFLPMILILIGIYLLVRNH